MPVIIETNAARVGLRRRIAGRWHLLRSWCRCLTARVAHSSDRENHHNRRSQFHGPFASLDRLIPVFRRLADYARVSAAHAKHAWQLRTDREVLNTMQLSDSLHPCSGFRPLLVCVGAHPWRHCAAPPPASPWSSVDHRGGREGRAVEETRTGRLSQPARHTGSPSVCQSAGICINDAHTLVFPTAPAGCLRSAGRAAPTCLRRYCKSARDLSSARSCGHGRL